MKQSTLKRAAPLALAAVSLGAALPSHHAFAASSSKKVKGAVEEQQRWGPIQVTITVKNKKITNVKAAVQPDNPRSTFIESQAIPMLKQEVLKAQSAKIDMISGATDTSIGYIESLQSAVKKAKKAHLL